MKKIIHASQSFFGELPFSHDDITAGSENELQTAVIGDKRNVDLSIYIEKSKYYKNLKKHISTGEISGKIGAELTKLLEERRNNVWENSWVIISEKNISSSAINLFKKDLLKKRSDKNSGLRSDYNTFFINKDGEQKLRIPVSYLFRLALGEFMACEKMHTSLKNCCESIMNCYINDNTSPETHSFYVLDSASQNDIGQSVARENAKRFLMTQAITEYSNIKFGLIDSGQKVEVYNSPLTPQNQKFLNKLIPGNLYREIFMSPCVFGWEDGEEKSRYMHTCHITLSQSKLNTISKLKDAGIIKNNLIVLPDTSSTSLTNNGIHVSLGSKMITKKLQDSDPLFKNHHEKYYGDLAIKIVEHFLPLFPGLYSASPYRIPFRDFHPENVLGFLPHELDFTHLRMLWRRWRKMGIQKVLGTRIYPKGPEWIDRNLERIFGLNGAYCPDYRLIDYYVALLSTDSAPSLNGFMGNQEELIEELHTMGQFSKEMSFYSIYKMRSFEKMGFSGFEGRFYSLFERIDVDMRHGVNLQAIITHLAYKYILEGVLNHRDIPDDVHTESERRQIFFGAALNIPTFYVSEKTGNEFLLSILKGCKNVRKSNRYKGYLRVKLDDYRLALYNKIIKDGGHLLEEKHVKETLKDLSERLHDKSLNVSERLTKSICEYAGAKNPLKMDAYDFNFEAEEYYRKELKKKHIRECFKGLKEDFSKTDFSCASNVTREIINSEFKEILPLKKIQELENAFMEERADLKDIVWLIKLLLLDISIRTGEEEKCNHTATFKEAQG